MVGSLKVGGQLRQTHIRLRNKNDYESCIKAIDEGYDAENTIFIGYNYHLNTPKIILVKRSKYGNGCDFKHQIVEYRDDNCYKTSNGYYFIKCIKFISGEDYKEQYQDSFRKEQRQSNTMTMAHIQPRSRKLGVNLGYYIGKELYPRTKNKKR